MEKRADGPLTLNEWFHQQTVDDEMLWKKSFCRQMEFFRYQIIPLFSAGTGLGRDEAMDNAKVISTHTSKSILLPVVSLSRPDLTWVLRNNFYNWKLSVISSQPVYRMGLDHKPQTNLFDGMFFTTSPLEPEYTGNPLNPVYFEGFPEELVFGYYSESDFKKWSAEIQTDHMLYTVLFIMQQALGHIKPAKWHTKESHRKELDAEEKRWKAKHKK